MKNKKALAIKFIVAILVVLVIMIIMLLFETRAGEIYKNLVNKNVCKASIQAQRLTSFKNIALPSDINCPMNRKEIPSDKPEQIKAEFAKRYADVCNEFGQGTLNLFGKEETTFCVIRDKISFKHKGIVIDDFAEYLAKTDMPGKGVKYIEFCSGFKTKRANNIFGDMELAQFEEVPIDTNKEYVIIFVYPKGEEEVKEVISFLAGTSEFHKTMYIGAALIVGGGLLIYTGAGSVLGVPLTIAGKLIAGGGLGIAGFGGILNYFTNPDIKMEWVSFFLIREFNEEELKKLPCKYMPAEQ